MQRAASIVLVPGLLIATGAAFATAEALKLTHSPVTKTHFRGAVFAPDCGCPTRVARMSFVLRTSARLRVDVVDANDRPVRVLLDRRRAHGLVPLSWNGREADGRPAPAGIYHLRVHTPRTAPFGGLLTPSRDLISVPNPIVLDTTPPLVHASVDRTAFSPDGDGRADRVELSYHSVEELYAPGHGIAGRHTPGPVVLVERAGRVVGRLASGRRRSSFTLDWNGRLHRQVQPVGSYTFVLVAADRAGNVARVRLGPVSLRFLTPTMPTAAIVAGATVDIKIATDAHRVRYAVRNLATAGATAGRANVRAGVIQAALPPGGGIDSLTVSFAGNAATTLLPVRAPDSRLAVVIATDATAADLAPWIARLQAARAAFAGLGAGDLVRSLGAYRAIVVPRPAALTASERSVLRTYVAGGGRVIDQRGDVPSTPAALKRLLR